MSIVVEPAGIGESGVERMLTGMAERGVAEVVREAECFGEVLIQAKLARDSPADLRDFDAVGETNAKVISIGSDEHLGLVAKAAESHGMNDPVAVALIDVARAPRARALFGMKAAARSIGSCGNSLRKRHSVPSGTI